MNGRERKAFWSTLCSLSGINLSDDIDKLRRTIIFPRFLYRYRPVSLSSLDALRTNKLYFSSANYYDDPFDTFLHIDIEAIKKECLGAFQTTESTESAVKSAKSFFSGVLAKENEDQLTAENVIKVLSQEGIDNFLNSALDLRDDVKKDTWSVCFSENGFNEVLWLKYANQHKGFVQIYDLASDENFLCGKQEKCAKCGIKTFGTPLYPIYYSDTSYDATNFAKIIMLHKMEKLLDIPIPQEFYNKIGTGFWERERTTLIKKKCHEYDEEWRMITGCQMSPPIMMEWIPSGIILGLRMDITEENLVVSMAKEAGISNIYKSYIDSQNQLNAALVYTKK